LTIVPFERARFKIISHNRDHLVDLLCHSTSGACSCVHFLSRLKPQIDADKKLGRFQPGPVYQCPHIKAARDYMLTMFLKELLLQFPDDEEI
jgi:hypothetical protein